MPGGVQSSDSNRPVHQPDSVDTETRVKQLRAETNAFEAMIKATAKSTINNTSLPAEAQKKQGATGTKPIKATTEGGFSKMLLQLVQKICMYLKYDTTLSRTTLTFGTDKSSVEAFTDILNNQQNLNEGCSCKLVEGKDGQYTLLTSQQSNSGGKTKSHWKLATQDGRIQLPTLFLRDVVNPGNFMQAVAQQRAFVSLQPHSSLPSNMTSKAKEDLALKDLGVAPTSGKLQPQQKNTMGTAFITTQWDKERSRNR